MNELKYDLRCFYEDKDAIGRRYRRQDAIGTPYCVTIDHQTLQDDTVTIRDRDSMKQERVNIADLRARLIEACSINNILRKI
jgi:glycyl-tRNA synthetase